LTRSRLLLGSVSILLWTTGAALTASSQTQLSSSQASDDLKKEEAALYADARPYLDATLPELKKTVHELDGLEPAPSQDQLSDLLAKAGVKADELLQRVPNLVSDEAVSETQWTVAQGGAANCTGTDCAHFLAGAHADRNQKFSSMILTHSEQDNRLMVAEYRTGRNGKPPQGTAAPHFQGFIATWLIFSSSNQVESRFRYLGQQQADGHSTFVIGFAQIPGSVESPGQIIGGKGSIPLLLQGIVWIDQSDFRIVRLRTDILAPQPQVEFQQETSKIVFGPVKVADSTLWLPQTVEVEMQANGQYLQERHQYSNYRLFEAKSKIILSPSN
jgi:hypothetical protein